MGRILLVLAWIALALSPAAAVPVDLTRYTPASGTQITQDAETLSARWFAGLDTYVLTLNLTGDGPLIRSITATGELAPPAALVENADIHFPLTVGSRKHPSNPIERFVFFDKPSARPNQRFDSKLSLQSVTANSEGKRTSISLSRLSAGPFSGQLVFNFYDGSPLLHIKAVMSQDDKDVAYIYDALLIAKFQTIAWMGLDDVIHRQRPEGDLKPVAVRNRAILAETPSATAGGSIAVFPPPHSFFFPRDRTDNLSFAQFGSTGFGLRQDPAGGGAFVPWFDAPPDRPQHMGMFLLLSTHKAENALEQVLKYTHNDSFKPLEGYQTFTSHYHSRLTVQDQAGKPAAAEFARVMKAMNVNIVHLAEFHGDGHPDDTGNIRLREMKAMFDLCQKHSDNQLLLIPGEEGSRYLAHPWPPKSGIHPGHWMYLFPKPVYLTWLRREGMPFSDEIAPYGTVYHVGSKEDMVRLLREQNGLAWTTHPRIKASFATPDAFKDEDFYKDNLWLGAAWKAMPADLSEERLGRRCLDLLDDMNNWGQRKLLPGEVDVFEIDRSHELYGHMNINYLRLPTLPRYNDWSPVLRALRSGDFFVTTGEILIHSFNVDDATATTDVEWTFPLKWVEVIWGDGKNVQRARLNLRDTTEFGRQTFRWPVKMNGAKWYRLEAWDIAGNGAFTQPTWIQ